jgi:hypothetical protein
MDPSPRELPQAIHTPAEAIAWMKAHPYGAVDASGVDRSLLDRLRQLTPTERARRLHRVVRMLRQRNATS